MHHALKTVTVAYHITLLLLINSFHFQSKLEHPLIFLCHSFYLWLQWITVNCVSVCESVCVRLSQELLSSDRGRVLFVTRTGLSPPPGVGIMMIVMAMECEWQAGSHAVAAEQEARTAPIPDISLSFIKTLYSFITTHSLGWNSFVLHILCPSVFCHRYIFNPFISISKSCFFFSFTF